MSSSFAPPAFLGIDLGTSQFKALLAGADGDGARVLGRGRAPYPVTFRADGQAQTHPRDWWRAAGTAVREAVSSAGGVDVTALAVAGQMHGVVLSDPVGAPLRPAILWLDRRAAVEAAGYGDLPAELTDPLGNAPSPGMAGPILRWLATHEPATLAAARWALQPKDWLRLRLTGEAATDPTDASGTLLYDLVRDAWAAPLVRALGLPSDMLPGIRDPAQIAGRLLPAAAAHLGLRPGTPVATGAADTAAALFAADLPAGAALLTLGTGGQWMMPARPGGYGGRGVPHAGGAGGSSPRARGYGGRGVPHAGGAGGSSPRDDRARTNLFRAIGPGLYRLAAVQNMGVTLNWVAATLGVSWEHLYSLASRPWRADTPVFLPYLAEERWDPGTAGSGVGGGTWAGLTLSHDRDDLLRSALEGVAFLLADRLCDLRAAGHDPARVVIGGGGARHPAWRQMLADVLGLPLQPAPTSWLSATGAARLAALAAGDHALGGSAPRAGEPGPAATAAPITPSAARGAITAAYDRYRIFVAANQSPRRG